MKNLGITLYLAYNNTTMILNNILVYYQRKTVFPEAGTILVGFISSFSGSYVVVIGVLGPQTNSTELIIHCIKNVV